MLSCLMDRIKKLYSFLLSEENVEFKLEAVKELKLCLGLGLSDSFGSYYINVKNDYKEKGVVYTPEDIAEYILKKTILPEDVIANPYMRILDPSCGCGNIVIQCFKHLRKLYMDNLDQINENISMKITADSIDEHIVRNNIFGIDVDDIALHILQIDLFFISGFMYPENFSREDFLMKPQGGNFDFIVGNPPYVGHKNLNDDYSLKVREKYKDILKDKGDLHYCFLSEAVNRISYKGKITFITSRYFLESPSGTDLRSMLLSKCSIKRIVDFYGIRPFKGIGIDPVILFLENEVIDSIEIIRPQTAQGTGELNFADDLSHSVNKALKQFHIKKSQLDAGPWMLLDNEERKIVEKIEVKASKLLSDLCSSYQGIISGCDKAFIVDSQTIKERKLEEDIIRPWIKSSYIGKYNARREDKHVIYSNLIDREEDYPRSLEYIGSFKERLANRRECRNGVRKWYELQWGRNPEVFEGQKIVFPYKSAENRFALDTGSYFSADVYALVIKDTELIDYETLLNLLNSAVYEFYFQSFAKKLGGNLYDYYPNNVMRLRIPVFADGEAFNGSLLNDYFQLTKNEISIIEQKGIR